MEVHDHDPRDVARNMVDVRGHDQARERVERYISGSIRSENSTEFWCKVRDEIDNH